MLKRSFLLILTNLAVLVLLATVGNAVMAYFGISLGSNVGLLVFAAVIGFGGAFVNLAISKWSAKRAMRVQVIGQPRNEAERWLLETVSRQAQAAGIKVPEVGYYEAPEINAFATGPSRNNALVAVSSGLLQAMSRDEAEAVIAHEVSHVANGDMVTLTLIQGVVNTFVIFLSRVVGRAIDAAIFGNRDGSPGIGYFGIVLVLDLVFGLFAQVIVMWFSRQREFRADAGGAHLAGKPKMIAALEKLGQTYGTSTLPTSVRAFGISGGVAHGLRKLFMSHPPLGERIQRLREARVDA